MCGLNCLLCRMSVHLDGLAAQVWLTGLEMPFLSLLLSQLRVLLLLLLYMIICITCQILLCLDMSVAIGSEEWDCLPTSYPRYLTNQVHTIINTCTTVWSQACSIGQQELEHDGKAPVKTDSYAFSSFTNTWKVTLYIISLSGLSYTVSVMLHS